MTTIEEARAEAIAVLKDEANELACLQTAPIWKDLPHRAKVAIQREITRLRQIASDLNPL